MKKLFLIMGLSVLMVVAGCGKNEVDGNEPAGIPIKWLNAEIQENQSAMLELLDDKSKALDPEDQADNKETIKKYKLTEWKASDERYFYQVEYEDPMENSMKTEKMEVIKTSDGWKRTKYGNLTNFDKLVEDLNPEVLRELHDE